MRSAPGKPAGDASRRISNLVGSLILLKETLELLPGLGQPLQAAESQLLQAIGANLDHQVFHSLLQTATQVLDEVGLFHSPGKHPQTWHKVVHCRLTSSSKGGV